MNIRERVRVRLARHENLFTLLWYLHLVRNVCPECGTRDKAGPDFEGLRDCRTCGVWF